MTDFLTADTNLPSYMMFPRFLLDMEINETAKMLYIILLDRARLSQKNEGWSDIDYNGSVVKCSFTLQLKHWQKFSTKAR